MKVVFICRSIPSSMPTLKARNHFTNFDYSTANVLLAVMSLVRKVKLMPGIVECVEQWAAVFLG